MKFYDFLDFHDSPSEFQDLHEFRNYLMAFYECYDFGYDTRMKFYDFLDFHNSHIEFNAVHELHDSLMEI